MLSTHAATPVRRLLRWLLIGCALGTSALVQSQEWPARGLRIIVPYGAGGASDVTTRMVASRLAERLRQPVIVENRPGGGSVVGVMALKQAAPDGYTLGLLVSANAAQIWLRPDLPFDVRRDFVPLTDLYVGPLVMTVPQSLPVRTLADFIAYARLNPGKVFAGSIGAGTTTHLAAELLNQVAGIQVTNVSFKGATEVHAAVVNGTVQAAFDNFGTPRPLIDSGRVRAIAVSGKARVPVLPDVPAIHESYPGFEIVSWAGFAAPPGTPTAISARLSAELREVMQDAAVRAYITDTVGAEPGGAVPQVFQQRIVNDTEVFGRVIRTAGIKGD